MELLCKKSELDGAKACSGNIKWIIAQEGRTSRFIIPLIYARSHSRFC
uniref:Uncharacterized protein n=1 Tax=Arundo donax TaxID=35708 RepID=A0A0A9F7L4_ARUDO